MDTSASIWKKYKSSRLFNEFRGTCSTKHAILAALADEHHQDVQLKMVICKLDEWSPEKIEFIWDAEINFFWVPYPESTRNLNRLMSIVAGYNEPVDD